MPEIFGPKKGEILATAAIAILGTGWLVASRYMGTRKISAAESLAESLLDVERLKEAARKLPDSSEAALAACAGYMVNMAYRSAEGFAAASGDNDPLGYSRTHTHPYTRAAATVLTEAVVPELLLTYAVSLPEVGEVRGTRRVGARNIANVPSSRPAPDTAQITLPDGYTAQIETEFEVTDYLVMRRLGVAGAATLRDNRDNVGRLHIAPDGTISGTITRNARVIGRFEGKAQHGLHFKQHQLEGA